MNLIEQIVVSVLHPLFALFKELILTPLQETVFGTNCEDGIPIHIKITRSLSKRLSQWDRPPRKVRFGQLEIRTYETILGDNPSCSRGPPLTIGWKYDNARITTLPVDVFENQPYQKHRPQYKEFDLIMDREEREETLLGLGYTRSEIVAATRRILHDKRKRRQTADNLSAAFMEEKVEGFKKSVRRKILLKKSTKAMYKNWKKVDVARREEADDTWHRAHSEPALSEDDREDSASTCGGLSINSEETSEEDDVAISMNAKSGKFRGRRPEHRRASL